MSDPTEKTMVGIVVKKDGTVPFDDGVHPEVKAHILKFLTENGHAYDPIAGTPHIKIRGWTPGKELHAKPA